MDMQWMLDRARALGFEVAVPIEAGALVPEERIRALCLENKCGNYDSHYMCPSHVGDIDEIRERLGRYGQGVLLQSGRALDVRGDPEGVVRSKLAFHQMVLALERCFEEHGAARVWGFIGGDCALCTPCLARRNESCPYPDRARTSLEAVSIDVLSLLERLGLDNAFRPDRITWTGCVLV